MPTLIAYSLQILVLGAVSSGFFIASSLVVPLKTEKQVMERELPRMTLDFSEFSGSWSAFEDDNALDEHVEETIPQNVVAFELAAGTVEVTQKPEIKLNLPALSMSSQDIPSASSAIGAVVSESSSEESKPNKPNLFGGGAFINPPAKATAAAPTGFSPQSEPSDLKVPHHWLQGKIELINGLAITHPMDEIHVGWFVEGQIQREGKVNLREGIYEIKVDQMEGEIIAELVDSKGYLLGETIIDLEQFANQRRLDQIIVPGVDLKIGPFEFGLKGQTVSIYDTAISPSPVGEVDVRIGQHDFQVRSLKDGRLKSEAISTHSTGLLVSSRSQFRDTLSLADFEKKQKIRMFPEKFLSALFETLGLNRREQEAGMIWGLVTRSQNPTSGYKVRLAQNPQFKATYFNAYLPMKEQEATSSDGQYVMTGLADGDYELELYDSVDQKIDSKIVSVRAGFVSQVEFEVSKKKTLSVRTFDPLSTTVKDVEMMTLGSSAVHSLKTEEVLRLPVLDGQDPFLIYSRPINAKVDTSVFASRGKKLLDVPVLNTEWWNALSQKHNIQVSSGVVIGFVDTDENFEVFLEDVHIGVKVHYFSRGGNFLAPGSQELPAGFVVTGVGVGLKTLVLQTESGHVSSELSYLDGQSVSLFYKAL